MEHSVITIIACLVGLIIGAPHLVVFAFPLIFTGREFAQAEYRWIKAYGHGLRANLPWWGMFDYRVWDIHSWFWNLLLPWVVAIIIYIQNN